MGNLVCPAMFDLGEYKRVLVISVTEGEDKPLKYPNMFETSHLCIINKSDLLPHVDFSIGRVYEKCPSGKPSPGIHYHVGKDRRRYEFMVRLDFKSEKYLTTEFPGVV